MLGGLGIERERGGERQREDNLNLNVPAKRNGMLILFYDLYNAKVIIFCRQTNTYWIL